MRMRLMAIGIGVVGICLAAPAAARAQADAVGSKDHPMLPRFPGYYIEAYDAADFSAYDFYVTDDELRTVEGHYWQLNYRLKEGAKKGGPLEIGRNYSNLFVQRGGATLYDNLDEGGGRLTARIPLAGKYIWIELDVSSTGEMYTLIVIEEAAMAR